MVACKAGQVEVVRYFLSLGADNLKKSADGSTGWDLALRGGHRGVLQALNQIAMQVTVKDEETQSLNQPQQSSTCSTNSHRGHPEPSFSRLRDEAGLRFGHKYYNAGRG